MAVFNALALQVPNYPKLSERKSPESLHLHFFFRRVAAPRLINKNEAINEGVWRLWIAAVVQHLRCHQQVLDGVCATLAGSPVLPSLRLLVGSEGLSFVIDWRAGVNDPISGACEGCAQRLQKRKKDWIAEELRDAADLSAEREACAALLPPLPLTLDNAVQKRTRGSWDVLKINPTGNSTSLVRQNTVCF